MMPSTLQSSHVISRMWIPLLLFRATDLVLSSQLSHVISDVDTQDLRDHMQRSEQLQLSHVISDVDTSPAWSVYMAIWTCFN